MTERRGADRVGASSARFFLSLAIGACLVGLIVLEYVTTSELTLPVALLLCVIVVASSATILISTATSVAARAIVWSALTALALAIAGWLAPLAMFGQRALLSSIPLGTVVLAPLSLVPTLVILLLYAYLPQYKPVRAATKQ